MLSEAMSCALESEHFFAFFAHELVVITLPPTKEKDICSDTHLKPVASDQNNQNKRVQPLTSGRSLYK